MMKEADYFEEPCERRQFLGSFVIATVALATARFANQSRRVCGEENDESEKASGTERPDESSLLVRSGWADIDVSLGHIQTICIHSAQTRTTTANTRGKEYYEKLSISGETDIPSVRYEAKNEQEDLSIHVINGNNVHIQQSPNGPDGTPVQFTQSPSGTMMLRIGAGESLQEFSSRNIWHLLLREPDICKQHLMPLLDACIASNHLMQDAQQIETGLLQKAGTPHVSRVNMGRHVHFLSSEKSEARKNAKNELYALGISALPYLESLDLAAMDNRDQQKHVSDAIRDIGRRYTHGEDAGSRPDTVERALVWLFEDPMVWSIFLKRADADLRAIALNELQAMYPHSTVRTLQIKFGAMQFPANQQSLETKAK